jgi:hypothetical protein
MRLATIGLATLAIALGLQAASTAGAATTLHLRFGAAQTAPDLLVGEPYVFTGQLASTYPEVTPLGSLTNEVTGVRIPFPRLHCLPQAIGGGWLVFDGCDPRSGAGVDAELYGLATGQWQTFTYSKSLIEQTSATEIVLSPNVVGADWLGFSEGCYHCGAAGQEIYQNISDGRAASDPTGPHFQADPNLPGLARQLCAPLTVPVLSYGTFDEPGIVYGSVTPVAGGLMVRTGARGSELVRCATHNREGLCRACLPAVSRGLVLWVWSPRELRGILLPSRRLVRVPMPARIARGSEGEYALGLTARKLYLLSGGRVFTAPLH